MKNKKNNEPISLEIPVTSNRINPNKEAFIIASIYTVMGAMWIIFTDELLKMLFSGDMKLLHAFQTYKGILYVVLTGILMYVLIFKRIKLLKKTVLIVEDNYEDAMMINEELITIQEELTQQNESLKESQEALMESELRYQLAVEGANDGIWEWDIVNDIYIFSLRQKIKDERFHRQNLSRKVWEGLIHPEDKERASNKLDRFVNGKRDLYQSTYRLLIDDQYYWILSKGKLHRDKNGKPIKMAGSHTDISQQIEIQNRLHKLAYYDALTGLPNRVMIQQNFDTILHNFDKDIYVLYIDIDNFKHINNTLGHSTGDKVLVQLSNRFKDLIKDPNVVARLSGDEYLIILREVSNIHNFLYTLYDIIQEAVIIDSQEFYITCSIGITIYPNDGQDLNNLLKHADTAMSYAKFQGKGRYCFYNTSMEIETIEYISMIKELRSATKKKDFNLHYQPIVDLNTRELVGVEALIRWFHKERGAIPPSDFIPIAEEMGYIKEITEWVFCMAYEQKKYWKDHIGKDILISINISGIDLLHEEMLSYIKLYYEKFKHLIGMQVEITETAVINNLDRAIQVIYELKKMGMTIALDDFGTGYSSLTYLKKLPIDVLKVDREFIKNVPQENAEKMIMGNVIKLAHDINLKVIAEGIETEEQMQFLKEQGCDWGQGYLLSKPMDIENITEIIASGKKF